MRKMLAANGLRNSSLGFTHLLVISFAIYLFLMSNLPTVVSAKTINSSSNTKTYRNYIKTACKSATYSKDCYEALSPHASTIKTDPEKLYKVALYITIRAASQTSSSISSLWGLQGLSQIERSIVRDCAENIGNAVDELLDSLRTMGKLRGLDRQSQMENIRTWVSAALTDECTCTDEFDGQEVSDKVNKKIKKTVLDLAKMTSNCLALVNNLNYNN